MRSERSTPAMLRSPSNMRLGSDRDRRERQQDLRPVRLLRQLAEAEPRQEAPDPRRRGHDRHRHGERKPAGDQQARPAAQSGWSRRARRSMPSRSRSAATAGRWHPRATPRARRAPAGSSRRCAPSASPPRNTVWLHHWIGHSRMEKPVSIAALSRNFPPPPKARRASGRASTSRMLAIFGANHMISTTVSSGQP